MKTIVLMAAMTVATAAAAESSKDLRGATFSTGFELEGARLTGARFDAHTRLPFAEVEAVAKGMVKVDVAAQGEALATR